MTTNWRKTQNRPMTCGTRTGKAARHLVYLCLVLQNPLANAAQPAWQGAPMRYVARNSRLADVLNDVGRAGGLRLEIARTVRGNVNGVFEQAPSSVFRTLVEAWGLVWYFDGQTIHITTAEDLQSRTIGFAPLSGDAVGALLRNLDLDDPHLPLHFSGDSVKVTGPSRYVDAVANAIVKAQEQLPPPQQTLEQTQIRVFPLRYTQAQDITYTSGNRQQTIAGVASLLRTLMGNTSVARPAATNTRGRPDSLHGTVKGIPPLPSVPGFTETAQDASVDDSPAELPQSAVTPARRNIVADPRTNSVVVYDVPAMMPAYEKAISMLDRPQDLVEISALVMDVSSDAARELGVRWGAGASSSRQSNTLGSVAPALPGASSVALGVDAGLTLTTLIGNSAHFLYEQIHALEKTGRARILSRPRVLTLNNAEAVLSSHNSIYVRVAGNQDANLFNVDTGLTLKVTPTVEQGGGEHSRILLSVQIEDGSFDGDASVDGIPRVNSNSIITQAIVGDGESLLIGGYEYEHTQTSGSKVPILGDIPIIGTLFGDEQTSFDRTERLVLITPRLKRLKADAAAPAELSVDDVPALSAITGKDYPRPPLPDAAFPPLPPLPASQLAAPRNAAHASQGSKQ
ncbi:type III secretion system outer membrane ring subunit SctC [Caballeronia sp. TF1N1]|uniref:type III secretion system outer membrane ring subunit SctC n=1 Tax=Caballeronia sp. TF1N1 TaxID=2878153 RepID=UPI001FCFE3D8|nr:type III secretion system outer membrane ring subunit SctC [Caballeronia sp. TF1N1]